MATVMPAVAADLHGLAVYALAFGAPLATSVVGMALAGAWVDAVGPRRPLFLGVALFAAGLLLCGAAPHMAVFVVGRGLQGLGAGMQPVALYALVGVAVPEPQRPRVFTYFSAAWVLPAMIGPAVSGLMLHTIGWRWVFLVVPALTVPAVAVTWPVVRGVRGAGGRVDGATVGRRVALAALAGGGTAFLQVAGSRPQAAWRAAAAATLVLVLWAARRLLPEGLFRLRRGVPTVIAVRGLIAAAFAGTESYLPLLLVRERRWDAAVAGAVLTLAAMTWTAGSWVQGRVADPAARYRFSRIGTALTAAGVAAVLVTALPGVPVWLAPLGWAVGGGGMGLAYSSTSLLVLHLSPVERHGAASSALTTSEALTSAVVLALGGALFAALLPAGVTGDASAGAVPYLAGIGVAAVAAAVAAGAAGRMRPAGT